MATTITWKGYTWDLKDGVPDSPGFGAWSNANVTGPDGNGYITLKITNPTAIAPIGCEMVNQTTGLGYGIYTIVVGTALNALDKNIVLGGLFPFYYGNPYIEFDVNETSNWDGEFADVKISHNVWYGTDPDNPTKLGADYTVPADAVQTHRFIWAPGIAIFDSYLGTGTGGSNYFHTTVTNNVPVPSTEACIINLWVYSSGAPGADDIDAAATDIVIRDFTFLQNCFIKSLSTQFADGDATTALLTAPADKTSGADFQAGKMSESSNPITGNIQNLNIV
jgi:hypothetical protein